MINFLRKSWQEGTQIDKANIFTAVFIGGTTHIFLYFLYSYIIPLPYESLILRLVIAFLCISTFFYPYLPEKIRTQYFPFYWHLMIMSSLTLNVTFLVLKNNFNEIYLHWGIFTTFLLALYVPNWFIFIIDFIISIIAGIALYLLTTPIINLNPEFNIPGYGSILFFTAFSGVIFVYSNKSTWLRKQRKQHLRLTSLVGSIVHEVRNPLNTINLAASATNRSLLSHGENGISEALKYNDDISVAINQANQIINIVLADLSEKPIEPTDFSNLEADETLAEIIKRFGYSSEDQKQKVKLDITSKNNFIFKAVADRFTFIIYNLLKNALYYLKDYPDSVVTVGAELKIIDSKEWNSIYVHDTGPGIPPHLITKLFNDFFTSGKKDGTGLGLVFCKRNMRIFDGDIICESEFNPDGKNGWTKFSLLFPKISSEEITVLVTADKRKKIFLVDDQETNLIVTKSKIEKFLPEIACDTAISGAEAVKMVRRNNYKLVLMDIHMPEINGVRATKEIRKFNQNIPIIAFTSLDKNLFLKEIGKNSISESDFHYYLNKPSIDNILYRTIAKWIMDIKDNFYYLGEKEQYTKVLKGRTIVLADDQQLMRAMTKKTLEMSGAIVVEASDGKELLETYKNSLDKNNKSSLDIIITDINMPPYDGDIAAQEIRLIEAKNNISHQDEIPITALSANGQKEDIHRFFEYQITDYFIKGESPESLIQMAAHYLRLKIEY